MKTITLGMLTCSNTTRVLDCPVGACLKDMYERKGAFSEYKDQNIELVGINACNGCPTLAGSETILSKIESLIRYGADHIHLSYCMLILCPFVKKYTNIIRAKYPEIHLRAGTHEPHQTEDRFRCDVGALLKRRRKTLIP
ncbi:MAG: CGGC domain-containing protein [Gemmatimonadota bacterium]|nr:MAG: CGGC domain-containing protein [Gemmatimonadota bacterium]